MCQHFLDYNVKFNYVCFFQTHLDLFFLDLSVFSYKFILSIAFFVLVYKLLLYMTVSFNKILSYFSTLKN